MWTKQNYYSYTEQLLFGTLHFTRVLYTFFQNYYYLLIKLLFWKQKRTTVLDHIQTKKYFWVVTARVFFQRFDSLMNFFFLNSLEQRDTDSLIATIPLWYSLLGVGYVSFEGVEWVCIQFVKCNTGVILSQSTRTWQPLCARCFLR